MTTYNTSDEYTGDGVTNTFSITFPYIKIDDLVVSVAGETLDPVTDWILTTATTVQLTVTPTQGQAILINRETNVANINTTFFPGSAIRARDLNDNFAQSLYLFQEMSNQINSL